MTPRLVLEPLRLEHAEEMAGLLDDQRLHTFTGGAPLTRDGLRERYGRLLAGRSADGAEEWCNWILRHRRDQVAVGWVQATVGGESLERSAAMAWTIGVTFQGRGFAREGTAAAIAQLMARGVRRFTANIHPDHRASINVARGLGMVPTGALTDGEAVWSVHLTRDDEFSLHRRS